ncbi:MAG: hypothetical protein HY791_00150 [Deltaproteobacteria bacterium]|nr:hypothetical protein [Deltaproteobacteria bacterium]
MAVLSGRAGPDWAIRIQRARSLSGQVVTSGATGVPALPPRPSTTMLPPIKGRPALRRKLEESATKLFDAWSTRRFRRLEAQLDESVWVLWGDGALMQHPRAELLTALANSQGKPTPAPFGKVKSYTFLELRAALARGWPEALDALLRVRDGLLVTFEVRPRDEPPLRLCVSFVETEDGPRAANLPLPPFDEPALLARRALRADEPIAYCAEEIVRRFVLGQDHLLDANRPNAADRLWLSDRLVTFSELVAEAAREPHRLGASNTVLYGTKEVPVAQLRKIAGPKLSLQIEREAPNLFGRALFKLDPRLTETTLATIDGSGALTEERNKVTCLLVRSGEEKVPSGGEKGARHRVAGVFKHD